MTTGRPVIIKQLPPVLDAKGAENLCRELEPLFESDRPCLVLDFSQVQQLNSGGIEFMLQCIEGTMKRKGDVKLAAVPPEVAVILQMTRVDRLFEIFQNCNDAVESFHRFSAHSLQGPISMRDMISSEHDGR